MAASLSIGVAALSSRPRVRRRWEPPSRRRRPHRHRSPAGHGHRRRHRDGLRPAHASVPDRIAFKLREQAATDFETVVANPISPRRTTGLTWLLASRTTRARSSSASGSPGTYLATPTAAARARRQGHRRPPRIRARTGPPSRSMCRSHRHRLVSHHPGASSSRKHERLLFGHCGQSLIRDDQSHAAECVPAALSITVCGQPTTNRRFRDATICRTREDTETRISDMESADAIATNCRSRTPTQNPVQSPDVLRTRLRRFAAYDSRFACDVLPQ